MISRTDSGLAMRISVGKVSRITGFRMLLGKEPSRFLRVFVQFGQEMAGIDCKDTERELSVNGMGRDGLGRWIVLARTLLDIQSQYDAAENWIRDDSASELIV